MTKTILLSLVLLAVLIGAKHITDTQREKHRVRTQTVRPLPGNADQKADAIHQFTIKSADTTWTYEQKTGNWHYPAYQNVHGLNDRIKRFLEGVVESQGTIVAFSRSQAQHYGFDVPTALTVSLIDSTGNWTQNIEIGRSLPGRDANEAFMALENADTLFHMHTDPRRILTWEREPNKPPLIDPKMLPTALARRAIVKITFTSGPVRALERVEIEPEDSTTARPQDGPTYEWYARINGSQKEVVSGSVYSYISFLNRIKYSDLHPKDSNYGFGTKTLVLTDDAQTADTLDIGNQTTDGHTYIRHRTTGQILSITQAKADLLFPTPAHLDTLSRPTPYDKAQPTGPFSLATP